MDLRLNAKTSCCLLFIIPVALLLLLMQPVSGSLFERNDAEQGDTLFCRSCGAKIASLSNQVSFDEEENFPDEEIAHGHMRPRLNQFVNPQNVPFQVVTVRSATETKTIGKKDPLDSFFPDYSWQIVTCRHCGAHLGWRYERKPTCIHHHHMDSQEKNHEPGAEGEEENDDDEGRNLKDALGVLEGVCLEKWVSNTRVEWCYKGKVTMGSEDDSRVMLGQYHELEHQMDLDTQVDVPHMMLDGTRRNMYEMVYRNGDECKRQNGVFFFQTTVEIMCCDSFALETMTEEQVAKVQRKHLRIEAVRRLNQCDFQLIVCHPMLCRLPMYKIPRKGSEPTTHHGIKQPKKEPSQSEQSGTNRCRYPSFYGLIWDNLLLAGSQEALWMDAIELDL